ncbi:hypothetical protein HYT52_01155 [Candidatus Woesearchaeota archaeon]|nr:hypothetical protein [Candidatus Woesearchaeota archaeon]
MLYIHKLTDLNMRSAETESVYLLRDLKQKFTMPLGYPQFSEFLNDAHVSETDLAMISQALEVLPSTIAQLMMIYESNNQNLEMINVERSINILKALRGYLQSNLDYALTLRDSLELNLKKLVSTLNIVPKAQSHEAKLALNTDISNVFEFLLRNQQFFFNCSDLVEEGALSSIKGLNESYMHGFLYHLGIEEELKKINANEIEAKVPKEICEAINTIKKNVAMIKEASERAYNINKRIVDLSVFLYTFVKWANGK